MDDFKRLTPLSDYLISQFDQNIPQNQDKKISVNPVVSEVATFYEKIRNAMDYREEDVILRAAIERILKRRLLWGGNAQNMAEPLVKELLWARYFPDVSESVIDKVTHTINLYFQLQHRINTKHRISHTKVNELILQLLSAEIENILSPHKDKELITNFMFQIYKDKVIISDDTEEARDVQVFIAVRRTFAKQDLALLRFHLFKQMFGPVSESSIEAISDQFVVGFKRIEDHLTYPLRDRIYTYIKNQTVPFFILEDILKATRGKNRQLITDNEAFKLAIINACSIKYKAVKTKVQTAILRGVIFILITKAIFALAVEGTYESIVYGRILWSSIALNTGVPPILMILAGVLIKTPDRDNSIKVYERINNVMFVNTTSQQPIILKKIATKADPLMNLTFLVLWLLAFVITIGSIVYILTWLNFNPVSQAVFIFFVAIVSFISYRINQTAHMYTIYEGRQGVKSVLFDFLFMPFIHLGRQLTESISKINIILFIFDLFIETPFKVIFGFFEEWFLFLRTQREKLG